MKDAGTRLRLIHAMQRATHRVGLHLARAGTHDVTQGEGHILSLLAQSHPMTVGELHRGLAHKRSTLTSILDRLEARGLVTRAASAEDRRTFVVDLTPEGRKAARDTWAVLSALEAAAEAGASARDVEGFVRVVEALERAAGARDGDD